ncbi:hypothetical protein NLI96_g7958 [Meripilus lineatus]|uniref:Uncharacterized protein n=1 Tax=Meripilus lineatus TaxID=2056292 RepID=A0AAD5UY77_9APHY|nr:hypothetical protein NLI96_g7958 [Physisporinus lineatus]
MAPQWSEFINWEYSDDESSSEELWDDSGSCATPSSAPPSLNEGIEVLHPHHHSSLSPPSPSTRPHRTSKSFVWFPPPTQAKFDAIAPSVLNEPSHSPHVAGPSRTAPRSRQHNNTPKPYERPEQQSPAAETTDKPVDGLNLPKFNTTHYKAFVPEGATVKCPWCGEFVSFNQSSFSAHIGFNGKRHVRWISDASNRCPYEGCDATPKNISEHILKVHFKRAYECTIKGCSNKTFKGDGSIILRHLENYHHDIERPARGKPYDFHIVAQAGERGTREGV